MFLPGNNLTSFLAFLRGLGLLGEAGVQPGSGLAVVAGVQKTKKETKKETKEERK